MTIQFLGHAAFKLSFGDVVLLIDPFLTGQGENLPFDPVEVTSDVTHIALTHGHADHIGDTVEIAKRTGATVICCFELYQYLEAKGLEKFEPMNHGGTVEIADGVKISMVDAKHSSAMVEDSQIIYLGNPVGLVIHGDNVPETIYHMGDTDIFGDMALVQERFDPKIGLVPVGDRFTMGGETAALACTRYFKFNTVIPCHFGTFPIIDQTADAFVAAMDGKGADVKVLERGGSI